MSLMGKGAITGIGETAYMRGSPHSAFALQIEASLAAIRNAGLDPKDIDGIIPIGITGAPAEAFATNFGIPDLRFSALTPMGGASGVAAVQCAIAAIAAGLCRHVLIPAGRNVTSGARAGVRIHQMPQFHLVTEFELPQGAIAPAQLYAPMARRHMELFGTTSRQFGEIAVAVRSHALLNGNAVMKTPITLADHQASRMIADPFRLLDCSLESDGGAALVVSRAGARRATCDNPWCRCSASPRVIRIHRARSPSAPIITRLGLAKAAPKAFGMAGVTQSDIRCRRDLRLLHLHRAVPARRHGILQERARAGGSLKTDVSVSVAALPTNTHGGLLSQAHMLGMNHIVELVRQLRGQGGRAQVDAAAEVGLVTGYGDLGDGAMAIMARG